MASIKDICGNVALDRELFEATINRFVEEFQADPHHRGFSWDHSHIAWQRFVRGRLDADQATLNLAFYLASWGMYRGSSDLLFRDYKVLGPAVTFLRRESANAWADCFFSNENPGELASRIAELADRLAAKLIPKLRRPDQPDHKPRPTDTLLSKILLNTLACVPAFDTEVKKALKQICPNYTDGSGLRLPVLRASIELARHNRELIANGQSILRDKARVDYPLTKVFDLYLWGHGNGLD